MAVVFFQRLKVKKQMTCQKIHWVLTFNYILLSLIVSSRHNVGSKILEMVREATTQLQLFFPMSKQKDLSTIRERTESNEQ